MLFDVVVVAVAVAAVAVAAAVDGAAAVGAVVVALLQAVGLQLHLVEHQQLNWIGDCSGRADVGTESLKDWLPIR